MSIIRVDKNDHYDVFIGRPSKYSNPFIIGKHGTRSEVIAKFEEYFKNLFNFNALLDELEGKKIACWCDLDQNCHGDMIIKLYNAREKLKQFNDILG